MKKYYYKLLDYCEDNTLYFSEEDLIDRKIWIGESEYSSYYNDDLLITKTIDNFVDDFYYTIEGESFDEADSAEIELASLVQDSFNHICNRKLSNKEINQIINILIGKNNTWNSTTRAYETLSLECEVLSILHQQKFISTTFKGNSQGDWAYAIYPEDLADIDYWETLIMNTGTEAYVSTDKLDSSDEFETADTYSMYITKWNDSDIAQEIADSIGCSVAEVEEI